MIEIKKLSLSEKKRLRANFGEHIETLNVPPLLDIQLKSYDNFIQKDAKIRKNSGLENVFRSMFPMTSNNENITLKYIGYKIDECIFNTSECKKKGLTYSGQLKIEVKLINKKNDEEQNEKNLIQEIYILDIPLMTEKGSFIINGTERVIVSQLHRSPGVFFEIDKKKSHSNDKLYYVAKIIPHRGAWLDIELDTKNNLYLRIDKKKKIPASVLLKALGLNEDQILESFLKKKNYYIKDKNELNIIKNNLIANNIYDKEYNILIKANSIINESIIDILIANNIKKLEIIDKDDFEYNSYIVNTFKIDSTKNQLEAMIEIYKILRPGEPPTKESSKLLIDNIFFNEEKYDLSPVGRMKFNKRMNINKEQETRTLSKEDIINVIKKLIDIKHGKDQIDDIDHLGNRRVRSVGEIIENQFKSGFLRIEKTIKEKLSLAEYEHLTPQDIINAKPIATTIREFFCSSQLSQFMDQNNPLSEITHKRRVSALGPGGLTRERAGFEVRDVHITHYGRLCPIETPEGPNIGLINSLAIYAQTNKYGFIETPYIEVLNKKVTNNVIYLSAIDENEYIIAQANAKINKKNNELEDKLIPCRYKNEFTLISPDKVQYIDISPKQIVSVAASLIPFLEHDDANRALMGSNMQRQAVPVIKPEKPLVGTGMERIVAIDSKVTITAKRSGIVKKVDASRIIIKVKEEEIQLGETGVDIYNLIKFTRSNYNTCVNQKPIVKKNDIVNKNDVLADGPATDLGELALGQNLLTAFMSWNGYNFEDSIIISENVVKKNRFLSIHIEELICIARDLKLGSEEITADIPNVNDSILSNLDESGIIYIGAEVSTGDILVGKVTPKGESQLTPEEKLLQAIFGEKASDVKDSSLRVPTGIKGNVIDVQIFTREGIKKDKRAIEIENERFENIKKDINDELKILKEDIILQIKKILINKNLKDKNSININEEYFKDIKPDHIPNIITNDEIINKKIAEKKEHLITLLNEYETKLKIKEQKLKQGDELPPGVLKIVKISIAMKRQIQPGDKISGRHGNKGVVSTIVPTEDMPYLEDGTPIDLILNPLGVPSRMNVGQVLETHLGWASKELGKKISKLIGKNPININEIKDFLDKIYNLKNKNIDFNKFEADEIITLAKSLENGIPMSSPVFDGIKEKEIKILLNMAELPESGKTLLYDGRTGIPFENKVTVGYKYIMKLNHLIDDKMHARSTGSYSLVSQQPLGGKSQFGGQRFGEMEVWALEAYGAAYTLQEMLTVKSDDISGRTKIYKNIIDNNYQMEAGIPESFNVISKEILSLGLNIELEND